MYRFTFQIFGELFLCSIFATVLTFGMKFYRVLRIAPFMKHFGGVTAMSREANEVTKVAKLHGCSRVLGGCYRLCSQLLCVVAGNELFTGNNVSKYSA